MKGSDEREVLFGRLFGFLALIRSGRLCSDRAVGDKVLDATMALLSSKGWLREVVVETLLEYAEVAFASYYVESPRVKAFSQHSSSALLLEVVLPKLEGLIATSLVDMTSSQLMLTIGIKLTVFYVKKKQAVSLESHHRDTLFRLLCYRLADIPNPAEPVRCCC